MILGIPSHGYIMSCACLVVWRQWFFPSATTESKGINWQTYFMRARFNSAMVSATCVYSNNCADGCALFRKLLTLGRLKYVLEELKLWKPTLAWRLLVSVGGEVECLEISQCLYLFTEVKPGFLFVCTLCCWLGRWTQLGWRCSQPGTHVIEYSLGFPSIELWVYNVWVNSIVPRICVGACT